MHFFKSEALAPKVRAFRGKFEHAHNIIQKLTYGYRVLRYRYGTAYARARARKAMS